jgi:outer membrane protein assembly factor BamD
MLLLSACSTKNKPDLYQGMSADQIYAQAQHHVEKENYAQVIKDFEALEARYPYGEYSHKAQLGLIHAYYKRQEPALAISAADRFIRMNPRHPETDYAYYLKGQVSYEQNTPFMFRYLPLDRSARDPVPAKDAYEAFKLLVEKFPSSQYVPAARQRISDLRVQLAHHELQVVHYYVKRGAHLAAANRANYIITNYGETPVVPEALAEMVRAYRQLGMQHLANETLAKLQQHFPNHDTLNNL